MPKILNIDFDGTINSYASGWCGPACYPDDPIEGAIAWLLELLDGDFVVCIHTSRFNRPSEIAQAKAGMRAWFAEHGIAKDLVKSRVTVTPDDDVAPGYLYLVTTKPSADWGLDDKVQNFTGVYPTL